MEYDICLINPPLDKKTTSKFPMSGVPLSIAYLAAYLRERKINVRTIDAPIEGWDHLRTAREVIKSGALIVGVTCLTENRYSALKTLRAIKSLKKDILCVIGGLHPTFTDKLIIENYPFVDIVVRGEGEETLYEIVTSVKKKKSLSKIKGISYRKNGKYVFNPDRGFIANIESLPFPAYDLFPMNKYPLPPDINAKVKQTSLVTTSRGCPMKCKFCATTNAWGIRIRSTSAERLFKEIKYLYEKFGVDYIRFADDLFTLRRQKVIDFCKLVIKNKLPIKFRIQARVDTVDEEVLTLLKKAGCDMIEYGAESGSDKVLKEVGKNITVEKIKKASYLTRKVGIEVKFFLIVGSLNETPNDTWQTFKLIKEIRPDWIGINPLTIYPGTYVYEVAKKEGLVNDNIWLDYLNPKTGNAPLYTKNYSEKEAIFLAQLGHVWTCRNSPKRKEYPFFERALAVILFDRLAETLVKNNFLRKVSANLAWIFSPFLP